jgi:hypothetical protein
MTIAAKELAQTVLDHAGDFYPWFDVVRVTEHGGVIIIAAESYIEGEDMVSDIYLSPADLRKAIKKTMDTWGEPGYGYNFCKDILAGNADDADGDMDAVDTILQTAMWGEPVFG